MIGCPDCGALQEIGPLPPGAAAACRVCDGALERTAGRSVGAALACSGATLLLLAPANLLPLLKVTVLGVSHVSHLGSGVLSIWREGWAIPAVLTAAFAVVLPFVRFGLLTVCLATVAGGRRPSWLGRAFRWAMQLDLWAMPDVFLIGAAVGYSRISASLPVSIQAGGYCLVAAALLCMLSRASLDARTVWRAILPDRPRPAGACVSCTACDFVAPASDEGDKCPRCGLELCARKPDAVVKAAALTLAALALYIPANVLPVNIDNQLGSKVRHTIIEGIHELFSAGFWPLGILVFCTSIAIPMLKIVGMGWFIATAKLGRPSHLRLKTRLYRLIDEMGRWSNIDVFTVAVFIPLMHLDGLISSRATGGATAFMLVVVLTMLASRMFDPRLMWDAAQERRP